jgi:hypothetical protein
MIEHITPLQLYICVVVSCYAILTPVLLHFRGESKKEKAAKIKQVVDDTILFDCGDLSQPIKTKLSWK